MKPLILFLLLSTAAWGQDSIKMKIIKHDSTTWIAKPIIADSQNTALGTGYSTKPVIANNYPEPKKEQLGIIEGFGCKLTGLPAWILVTAVMIVTVSIIIAGFIAIIVPLWLWIIEKAVGFYKVHENLFTYMLNRKEFKNWLNRKK